MQHGGGLDKNGLSPSKFQFVEQSTLIFGQTRKFIGPTRDGCGLVGGLMSWAGQEGVWLAL
jgi:hypothetical protein